MKKMNEMELKNSKGGAISAWGIAGIVAGAIFIIGLFDGIARPLKCN